MVPAIRLIQECCKNWNWKVSRCHFGSHSPFVKNVLDRSIGYLQPFFRILGGEMHHVMRYDNHMTLTVHFYEEAITKQEKETAAHLLPFLSEMEEQAKHTALLE